MLNSFNRDKFIHSINNDEEMTKVMVSISWCMPSSSTIIVAWLDIRWEEKIWEKYSNQVKMEWTSDSTQTIKVAGGIDTILIASPWYAAEISTRWLWYNYDDDNTVFNVMRKIN